MELTQTQYERIAPLLPTQRGNVRIGNRQVLNAILYVAEHGCQWRNLPPRFGHWHTIYTRMNRWAKKGVLDRVFVQLQRERILRIRLATTDYPDRMGTDGIPNFIWLPQLPEQPLPMRPKKNVVKSNAST